MFDSYWLPLIEYDTLNKNVTQYISIDLPVYFYFLRSRINESLLGLYENIIYVLQKWHFDF